MSAKPCARAVREALADKLGLKRSRVYSLASELAVKTQTDTETGLYLLAAQSGIKLMKYLPKDKVESVRHLLPQVGGRGRDAVSAKPARNNHQLKAITLIVGKTLEIDDPIITERVLKEARTMAEEVYPLLYVFENSVREFIIRVMGKAHGVDWWKSRVPNGISTIVRGRMEKEDRNPWHGRRGAHPIYYTDLEHLGRIVENNWEIFKPMLPSARWLAQRLEEIAHSRNPAMHMNPLARDDIQRVEVYVRDWEKLLKAKKSVIPDVTDDR